MRNRLVEPVEAHVTLTGVVTLVRHDDALGDGHARGLGVVMVDRDPAVEMVADELDGETRTVVADVSDAGWIDVVAATADGRSGPWAMTLAIMGS